MNIDELKSDWARYNHRLETSGILSQKLVETMLRERSRSRVSRIRNESRMLVGLLIAELALLIAVVAGNPFDFIYTWQFVPYFLLAGGVITATGSLLKTIRNIGNDLNHGDLAHFLQLTVSGYDKNKKFQNWLVTIFFSAGLLTILSFIPQKLEIKEFWQAMGETLISVCVSLVIYYIVWRSGVFNSRKKMAFENDLRELEQLRLLAADLNAPVTIR